MKTKNNKFSAVVAMIRVAALGVLIGAVTGLTHASASSDTTTPSKAVTQTKTAEFSAAAELDDEIRAQPVPLTDANRGTSKRVRLVHAETNTSIAVVYPDIGEPYRSVFAKIIEGIEDKTKARVATYAVGADANTQFLADELRRQNVKVVIALGRHGLRIAGTLNREIGIVAGGIISAPESEGRAVSILSLAPDPELMFGRLKELMPSVRRVHVVYNPQNNAWLLRLAREAAKLHGLELKTYEATDLRAAVRHYQQIVSTADVKQDALWLPQDATTVEDSSVLPLVLEKSWDRSLVVFSSNVAHVRRGALFSLYPNNIELGRNLATSALGYIAAGTSETRGIVALKDVLMAVYVRTAGHLGLRLSYEQQRRFDLVFPQP